MSTYILNAKLRFNHGFGAIIHNFLAWKEFLDIFLMFSGVPDPDIWWKWGLMNFCIKVLCKNSKYDYLVLLKKGQFFNSTHFLPYFWWPNSYWYTKQMGFLWLYSKMLFYSGQCGIKIFFWNSLFLSVQAYSKKTSVDETPCI